MLFYIWKQGSKLSVYYSNVFYMIVSALHEFSVTSNIIPYSFFEFCIEGGCLKIRKIKSVRRRKYRPK